MRNIGVVGSREYPHLEHVGNFVLSLNPKEHVIVSGGARGVDRAAAEKGRLLGFEVIEHRPQHEPDAPYFKVVQALFARNTLIARDSDELHAFIRFGIRSNGTFDTILKAAKMGKDVHIHYLDGQSTLLAVPVPLTKKQLESFVYFWESE